MAVLKERDYKDEQVLAPAFPVLLASSSAGCFAVLTFILNKYSLLLFFFYCVVMGYCPVFYFKTKTYLEAMEQKRMKKMEAT